MTKTEYAAYLCSDHWQNLRREILDFQSVCERCGVPRWLAEIVYGQDLHLHHKSYAHLGDEPLEDLEVLCRRCHDIETFGRSDLGELPACACELCGCLHWDKRAHLCPTCAQILQTPHLMYIRDRPRPLLEEERVWEILLQLLFCSDDVEEIRERRRRAALLVAQEIERAERFSQTSESALF